MCHGLVTQVGECAAGYLRESTHIKLRPEPTASMPSEACTDVIGGVQRLWYRSVPCIEAGRCEADHDAGCPREILFATAMAAWQRSCRVAGNTQYLLAVKVLVAPYDYGRSDDPCKDVVPACWRLVATHLFHCQIERCASRSVVFERQAYHCDGVCRWFGPWL